MELDEKPRTQADPQVENPTEASESTVDTQENASSVSKQTKETIIERLREIDKDACNANKQELDSLKQNFYKLHKSEQENARKAFLSKGGEADKFIPEDDPLEKTFKEVMNSIKEKRSIMAEEIEQQKENNLKRKLDILDRMKELTETQEDTNKIYSEFKQLQQEWNELKLVPASKVNELWKSYQLYTEKFYDMVKLNNEFREYDFKKNLEQKTHLCEAAEKLADEPDPVSAFYQLQKLHQEFRSIGPVAKDLRESIWARFKAASTAVNRRHQQHFEELKEKEQQNLDQKTVICEIVESMEYDTFRTFNDWDTKTKEVLALQAKWKTIGYAPQKQNMKIFERFRTACDEFFKKKSEFYDSMRSSEAANLTAKEALIQEVKALEVESREALLAAVKDLQRKWTEIGHVPMKEKDRVYADFRAAIDEKFGLFGSSREGRHRAFADIQTPEDAARMSGKDVSALANRISKLRADIVLWENNMGFISSAKSSNVLRREFERKIQSAKQDLALLEAKLKMVKDGSKEGMGKEAVKPEGKAEEARASEADEMPGTENKAEE